MEQTLISVTGYGSTGSSAVIDLLKEFGDIDAEKGGDVEFQIIYFPDAIRDLDYKLNDVCCRFFDSDVAIARFLEVCRRLDKWYYPIFHGAFFSMAKEFIDSLEPIKWNGYWAFDRLHTPEGQIDAVEEANRIIKNKNAKRHFANRFLRKFHLPLISYEEEKQYYEKRTIYQCSKPQDFDLKVQKFTSNLISFLSVKESPFLLINMLLPPNFPSDYLRFFDRPVKSIVVNRDPRDLFISKNITKWPVVPYGDVDTFIKWYRDNVREDLNERSSEVLRLNYEDLIYEYEPTVVRIKSFLGLGGVRNRIGAFDPHKSVVNTQLWKKYPEYSESIKKIEELLPEFLYDYDAHNPVECIASSIF